VRTGAPGRAGPAGGQAHGQARGSVPPDPVGAAAKDPGLRHPPPRQSSASSTSFTVPISSSTCAREMISGGDMAMMSPVVRISTPFS